VAQRVFEITLLRERVPVEQDRATALRMTAPRDAPPGSED
jgi:hypothetical protein